MGKEDNRRKRIKLELLLSSENEFFKVHGKKPPFYFVFSNIDNIWPDLLPGLIYFLFPGIFVWFMMVFFWWDSMNNKKVRSVDILEWPRYWNCLVPSEFWKWFCLKLKGNWKDVNRPGKRKTSRSMVFLTCAAIFKVQNYSISNS